jgi:hypothetical protein
MSASEMEILTCSRRSSKLESVREIFHHFIDLEHIPLYTHSQNLKRKWPDTQASIATMAFFLKRETT